MEREIPDIFNNQEAEKKQQEIRTSLYREVFGSTHGKLVLADILNELCLWNRGDTTEIEYAVLSRVRNTLLINCGIFPDNPSNTVKKLSYVEKMLEIT